VVGQCKSLRIGVHGSEHLLQLFLFNVRAEETHTNTHTHTQTHVSEFRKVYLHLLTVGFNYNFSVWTQKIHY